MSDQSWEIVLGEECVSVRAQVDLQGLRRLLKRLDLLEQHMAIEQEALTLYSLPIPTKACIEQQEGGR